MAAPFVCPRGKGSDEIDSLLFIVIIVEAATEFGKKAKLWGLLIQCKDLIQSVISCGFNITN